MAVVNFVASECVACAAKSVPSLAMTFVEADFLFSCFLVFLFGACSHSSMLLSLCAERPLESSTRKMA
jgi:hypothetical protein